jgi:hypothetical protein
MKRPILLALVSVTASLPAAAQEDWSVWETDWKAEAGLVLSPGANEQALYRLGLGVDTNRVLDNGLVLGFALQLDAQQDHPARAGFSGVVADPAPGMPAVTGAFSGLAQSIGFEDDGARGELQTAYLYAEGGYGEVRLGRDEGVAKRFSQGAPSLFSTVSLHAPRLDPEGGAIVRTDHDLTGPAAKISYTTPRIVGFKGGLSYTPDANVRGLDRDPARIVPGHSGLFLVGCRGSQPELQPPFPGKRHTGARCDSLEPRGCRCLARFACHLWYGGNPVRSARMRSGRTPLSAPAGRTATMA